MRLNLQRRNRISPPQSLPARSMPSLSAMVPKFTSSEPIARLKSAISCGAVAMIGLAPSANVALAD